MKKRVCLLVILFLLLLSMICCADEAEVFTSGNYQYTLTEDGTAVITDFTGKEKNLHIPEELDGYKVTGIGTDAFLDCDSLKTVTIPDGVTSIGHGAFFDCDSLKTVTIPESVVSIGDEAFSGCALKTVTIPDGVTRIGDGAFSGCDSLTEVTIPDSVTEIGANPFRWCTKLREIHVSLEQPLLAVMDGVLYDKAEKELICYPGGLLADTFVIPQGIRKIGDYAFAAWNDPVYGSLTTVTIPEGVTSIGEGAFHGCSFLTTVTIPDSMTSIGDLAFFWCFDLTGVTIPDNVTEMGINPFVGCSDLDEIRVSPEHPVFAVSDGVLFNKVDEVLIYCPIRFETDSYVIPQGIRKIDAYAFFACESLTEVTIPDSVMSIGVGAFTCQKLTSVTISAPFSGDLLPLIFGDCSAITFTVPRGSELAAYCKENGLNYTYPDPDDWLLN